MKKISIVILLSLNHLALASGEQLARPLEINFQTSLSTTDTATGKTRFSTPVTRQENQTRMALYNDFNGRVWISLEGGKSKDILITNPSNSEDVLRMMRFFQYLIREGLVERVDAGAFVAEKYKMRFGSWTFPVLSYEFPVGNVRATIDGHQVSIGSFRKTLDTDGQRGEVILTPAFFRTSLGLNLSDAEIKDCQSRGEFKNQIRMAFEIARKSEILRKGEIARGE
jgi:hypothetical protein